MIFFPKRKFSFSSFEKTFDAIALFGQKNHLHLHSSRLDKYYLSNISVVIIIACVFLSSKKENKRFGQWDSTAKFAQSKPQSNYLSLFFSATILNSSSLKINETWKQKIIYRQNLPCQSNSHCKAICVLKFNFQNRIKVVVYNLLIKKIAIFNHKTTIGYHFSNPNSMQGN